MALSAAQVDGLRAMLTGLSGQAKAALADALAGVDMRDFGQVRLVLDVLWPDLVSTFGSASSAMGALMFEVMADELGVAPTLAPAGPVDIEAAMARMRWAVGARSLGTLQTLLDELVKQPARETIADSAHASGGAWARVPEGRNPCSFCLMLASRGAVYETSATAGGFGGREYHGDCECHVAFVRGPEDFPEGYDPGGLSDLYAEARRRAGSGDPKKILAALREMTGGG